MIVIIFYNFDFFEKRDTSSALQNIAVTFHLVAMSVRDGASPMLNQPYDICPSGRYERKGRSFTDAE